MIAGVLFILSLAGLSHQKSAKAGNTAGKIGMGLALAATVFLALLQSEQNAASPRADRRALLIGAVIGTIAARRVEMTQMPQMIAILHSFVGLAAVLVGFNSYLTEERARRGAPDRGVPRRIHRRGHVHRLDHRLPEIVREDEVGAPDPARPQHAEPRDPGGVSAGLLVWFLAAPTVPPLILMTVLALLLGLHLVAAIGGGDMPVVVSMLNSYSGWAAAAAGFMLSNNLLIITGALVGSSGAILATSCARR